jgi:hypothetical protein
VGGLCCSLAHEKKQPVHKADVRIDWKKEQRMVDERVPRVYRLSMRWFKGVREQITNQAIRIAIDTGDPTPIVGAFEALPKVKPPLPGERPNVSKTYSKSVKLQNEVGEKMMSYIIDAAMTSGREAFRKLPVIKKAEIGLSFDIENPYVAPGAQERVGWLIQEVQAGTNLGLREAVAGIITRSYDERLGWEEAAKELRSMVGLRPDQVNAVNKIADRLIANGATQATVQSTIVRESLKRVRYRADMIAHTETARAVSTGRHDAWKVARDADLFDGQELFVEWVAGITDRTCAICADLHGTTVPLGDEFQPTSDLLSASQLSVEGETPPIHPLCRCTTILRIGQPEPFRL